MIVRLIGLISLVLVFISCEEATKNEYRDNIGACIPEGQLGIVVDKYEGNRGGETQHYIVNKILKDSIECTNLVSVHDFRFVKIGDTLSKSSARSHCLKVYGESCKSAYWRNFKFITYITVFLVIPFFLYFIYSDKIDELFKSTCFGKAWTRIKGFFNEILNVNYGFNIFLLITIIAQVLLGAVLWNFGFEMKNEVTFQYVINRLIILNIATIVWFLIIGGIDNLMRNLMVFFLGAIFLSILTLFFSYIGLSYKEMLKIILKPSNG